MIVYKLRYSDSKITTREFDTEKEAEWFIHNEGDHLREASLIDTNDIEYRLLKRAEIRRQIKTRKSVQEGAPDRISDLLEEAANVIHELRNR